MLKISETSPHTPVFTLATANFADQLSIPPAVHGHASIAHCDRRFPRITAWLHRASRLVRAYSFCVRALIFRERRRILEQLPGTAESDSPYVHPRTAALTHFRSVPRRRSFAPLCISARRLRRPDDPVLQHHPDNTGSAFVIGTDAPVASVVSFNATIQSVDAIDADGNSVPLVSGSPMIDFARYNGLQTLDGYE